MHPYTVYGIETCIITDMDAEIMMIACTLIPFTVLKLSARKMAEAVADEHCMHPYTVYGIETGKFSPP